MAVQIVYSSHRGSRDIVHIGSAHDDGALELLKAAARQRLAAGQGELDLGLDTDAPGGPLPVTGSSPGKVLPSIVDPAVHAAVIESASDRFDARRSRRCGTA